MRRNVIGGANHSPTLKDYEFLYDFEFEFTWDEETNKRGFHIYSDNEQEFNQWVVLIMKLRDWLIDKEKEVFLKETIQKGGS